MAAKSHDQDVKKDVLTLMAQGKGNKEICGYYPDVPESTVKRWRREDFAPVAGAAVKAKNLPKAKKIVEPIDVAKIISTTPPPPLPPDTTPATQEWDDGDNVPDDMGTLIARTLVANLKGLERMAKIVSSEDYVRRSTNGHDMAQIMKVMSDSSVRILEAAGRHHHATHEQK